ncbi:MAG TPA: hypothetical protein VMG38_20240 [Trebonia sp.]|nr:hypothetical protein [Trebonia sp.]
MPGRLPAKGGVLRKIAVLGPALTLALGLSLAGGAMASSAATVAPGTTPASPAGTLPLLPDGLNVAIGAPASASSGSAPGTSLGSIDDGDGTTRWCPGTMGIHTVTLDLGRTVDVSGTGVTFSGEEPSDGSFYSIKAGLRRSDE